MQSTFIRLAFTVSAVMPVFVASAEPSFWSVARESGRPSAAPEYGDVVFSVRWNRPRCNLSHVAAFHANRIEWSYITDYSWVEEAAGRGYILTGALNTSLSDKPAPPGEERTYELGRIVTREGGIAGPKHILSFGARVGCFNSPAYRALFVDRAKALAKAGVHGIQVDGPSGSWGSVVSGRDVCFCEHCRTLARKRGQDIDEQRTRSLLARSGLKQMYGIAMEETRKINPHLTWSKNVHKDMWFEGMFDYEFAELDPEDGIEPESFLKLRKRVDRSDRFQIYTLRSDDVRLNQQTIALAYATGSLISVPYDVYPADGYLTRKRFYGKAHHFAPQYALARGCAGLLNGFESAFFEITGQTDTRWEEKPMWLGDGASGDHALFARARPGKPESGLTVHLLARAAGKTCSGMVAYVREEAITPLGDHPKFVFYSPGRYDKAEHEAVEKEVLKWGRETGNLASEACRKPYQRVTETTELLPEKASGTWEIRIPDFLIHGILHIAPSG